MESDPGSGTTAISVGLEKSLARATESYLTKVVGSRLAQGLLSENVSPVQVVNCYSVMGIRQMNFPACITSCEWIRGVREGGAIKWDCLVFF